jgi:hypothetical protein
VAAGRQHRHEVVVAVAQLSRTRDPSVLVPFKRCLRLTSGLRHFFYLTRFSNTHILIFELVTFLLSKFLQMFHRDSWNHKEQLSFLAQLQIPKGLHVIIFGINSNLNFPRILKGFKPFCKILINSLKFYPDMIYLNKNLH